MARVASVKWRSRSAFYSAAVPALRVMSHPHIKTETEKAGGRISPGDRQCSAGGRRLDHWKLKVSFGRIFSSTSVVVWGVNDISARRTTGDIEQVSERRKVIYEAGKKYSKYVIAGLRREVGFSGILRSVWWQFLTDASGQPVGPIFKGQTWRVERWVVPKCPWGKTTIHCVIPQKIADLKYSIYSLPSFDQLLIVLQTVALIVNQWN